MENSSKGSHAADDLTELYRYKLICSYFVTYSSYREEDISDNGQIISLLKELVLNL
jgi:hypothetical protein